ncbi:MAG: AraC family ligand binding domain-containing protein [Alcanivoracaceae bacterium]|nr:AraC family ligand binding domain-containing protein [Alcanivoracaceae bacterium]
MAELTTQISDWPLAEGGVRVLLPQHLVQLLREDTLSSDCYPSAFGFYPAAHGHHMTRHSPDDHLVIYCIGGGARVRIGESQQQITSGDLLLLPRGVAHEYSANEEMPWSIFWMHLNGGEVDTWFDRFGAMHGAICSLGLHDRLAAEFQALLRLTASGYNFASGLHAAILSRGILSYALLLTERRKESHHDINLGALHLFMQQKLGERLTLAQLAAAAEISSKYQFIRQYKALTGQTPMQAFLHLKVSRACYLLEISDANVTDIAREFGFDDPYYFSRLFKKVVGVSPAKYRSQGKIGSA